MSKSKGNVVDPLELIDAFGADALRFAMAAQASQGSDVKFSRQRVEGYRNFATKLWNAARFAEINGCVRVAGFDAKKVRHTLNRWIVGETARTAAALSQAIESYRFNEAAATIYEFIWGRYCDWYLELAKPVLSGADEAAKAETRACAAWVLDETLALLHPFMPFITEELWAKTAEQGPARTSLLALANWPVLDGLGDAEADAEIGWLIDLVSEIRSVRTEMNVPAGARIPMLVTAGGALADARFATHGETIKRLARLDSITKTADAPKGSAVIIVGETTAALPLEGVVDLAAERQRLSREVAKYESEIAKIDAKLANEQFVTKAPPEVVEEIRERKAEFGRLATRLGAALKRIEA
jgi:valyl-tRNA synthetase